MVILVLNCGSSSIKYQVIDMEAASSKLLAKGIVERIGLPEGDLTHKPVGKEPFELHRPIPDHTTGIKLVLDALTDPAHGVIGSLDEVTARVIGALRKDILGRESRFEIVPVDESYPAYLREHLDEYRYLMYPVRTTFFDRLRGRN